MDVATVLLHRRLQLLQVRVEVGQRVLLDVFGVVAEFAAAGQGRVAAAVAGKEGAGQADEGGLERRVSQRLLYGAHEVVVLVSRVLVHGIADSGGATGAAGRSAISRGSSTKRF